MHATGVVRVSWSTPLAYAENRNSMPATLMQVRAIKAVTTIATTKCPIADGICDLGGLPGNTDVTIGTQAVNDYSGVSKEQLFKGIITWPPGKLSVCGFCRYSVCSTNNPQPCLDTPKSKWHDDQSRINEAGKCIRENTAF